MRHNTTVGFSTLLGKTLKKVHVNTDEILFETEDGEEFKMHHLQDCCESVYVEDIAGDIVDLVDSPILLAEEVVSGEPDAALLAERKAQYEKAKAEFVPTYSGQAFYYYGPCEANGWLQESETWTFYKLSTIKGSVTIRWYGSSNGYYSESVHFEKVG